MPPITVRPERYIKKLLIDIYMDGNILPINTRPKRCVKVLFHGNHLCSNIVFDKYKDREMCEKAVDDYPSLLKYVSD